MNKYFYPLWESFSPLLFTLYKNILKVLKLNNGRQKYTNNWAESVASSWQKILLKEGYVGRKGLKYLEIGSYEGQSLFWMLDNILTSNSATAVVIDIFGPKYGFTFHKNLLKHKSAKKVKLLQGYSRLRLRELPLNSFDLIYIDGSHSMADVMLDVVLSWDLLKVGGVIILDDYLMGHEELDPQFYPKKSIDTFVEGFQRWIEVLHKDYQLIIKKTGQLEGSLDAILEIGPMKYNWYKRTLHQDGKKIKELSEEESIKFHTYLKEKRRQQSPVDVADVKKLLKI